MKKKLFATGFWALAMLVVFTGCVALNKALIRNVVYDETIPESQMAVLMVGEGISITSFNGERVTWYGACKVKIPAGNHSVVLDLTIPSNYAHEYSSFGTEIYTQKIISNIGSRGVTVPPTVFEAGHRYFFYGGKTLDNRPIILVEDGTNSLVEVWGDTVKAPAVSGIQTEFEGTWRSPDNIVFTFTGNSWVRTLPPKIWDNSENSQSEIKGTFEYNDGKITMYYKLLGGFFGSSAYIYDYSLDGENMMLEVNGRLPKAVFKKQLYGK